MRRVDGNPNVSLIECTNPVKGLWRIRWDIQTSEESTTYMEEEFDHKPTAEEIKATALSYYNEEVTDVILSGMEYDGALVWLSTENQFNYKAAYDMAVQTDGQSLPVTFKFGSDEEPIYKEFTTLEELRSFYTTCLNYVQTALKEGWNKKDSFDVTLYE